MSPRTIFYQFARIMVGLEFIFSGFVKVVDPYGTGLKLQEYFDVFAQDVPFFAPVFHLLANSAQGLSLLFCASEFILGFALLVSFRMRITAWIVLGMMGFFTFLTFYSAFFNKVTDCGCFGDFLKLKPWHSFWKDIISLIFIIPIFLFRKHYRGFYWSGTLVTLASLVGFGIGIYALLYLPPLDFLPYAKGKSIPDQMAPTGIAPLIEYTFQEKDSKKQITTQEYLMDTARYQYVQSITLNEEEITPKITDYSISDTLGNDWTTESLTGDKVFIAIKKLDSITPKIWEELRALYNSKKKGEVQIWFITSVVPHELARAFRENDLNAPIYTIDEKVLKTMARTNPCILQLKQGTVVKKWSHRQIPFEINP
ncbi:MAG: BT_3928 family protein [Spirosomataceae bacterium]